MWLAKPVYEAVPYAYCTLGLTFLCVAWFSATSWLSALLFVCGCGLLLIGLVLWLRRRDFRDAQRAYHAELMDDSNE